MVTLELHGRSAASVVALVIVIALGVGSFWWLRNRGSPSRSPASSAAWPRPDDRSVALDLDQAHYASIIVGLSVKRGLPPRAASIAMATVYQETGIRNLDYGDRDSVGLFQQRPSQGWGTEKQLMDPYYATGKFYDALVKIDELADRRHQRRRAEGAAQRPSRGLPRSRSRRPGAGQHPHRPLPRRLQLPRPDRRRRRPRRPGQIAAQDLRQVGRQHRSRPGHRHLDDHHRGREHRDAWAYAHHAVANAKYYGVTGVKIGDRQWQTQDFNLPEWTATTPALPDRRVEITLR